MLVTVAIPVFNGERYIRQAMEGILSQIFCDFELLVINDASTDATRSIVESYRDSRLRLVNNERNMGGYGNFNKCLNLAKGKYVFVNHADDIMMPELLKTTVALCESNAEMSCVGVNAIVIDAQGGKGEPYFTYTDQDIVFTTESFLDSYFERYTMAVSSVLLRKDVIKKNRLQFDKKHGKCADMTFWVKLALCAQQMHFVHTPLFYRRVHDSQWSASFFKTEQSIDEYITRTDLGIIQALVSSKLNSEKKVHYVNHVLEHMYKLSLSFSARKRDEVLCSMRKKVEPLVAPIGATFAKTVFRVF